MKEFSVLSLIPLTDPGSRLFWAGLLGSGIIALLYFWRSESWSGGQKVFESKYWWHASARVDYQVFITNLFIKLLFFAPLLGLSLMFSKFTLLLLLRHLGGAASIEGNAGLFFVVTFLAFVFDDFLRFFHHWLMHRVPFLWSLHKSHHSAEVLNPMTLFRIHPLESAIATVRNAFSAGVTAGVLMYLFSGKVELWTLMGVNAFAFVFNLTFGNIRHSHLPIHFGPFERFFISPKQHQIHHSNNSQHFDRNFGVVFSIWDQLFGTWMDSRSESITAFGLDDVPSSSYISQYIRWPQQVTKFGAASIAISKYLVSPHVRTKINGGSMKILFLSVLMFPILIYANPVTFENTQFSLGRTWTWSYSEWSEESQEWDKPYLFETYEVVRISGGLVSIEMSSVGTFEENGEPHHKFVANLNGCLKKGRAPDPFRSFKIQFYTKSFGKGWELVSKFHKALAFTEKFNCYSYDEQTFLIKDFVWQGESLEAFQWQDFPIQTWYFGEGIPSLKGVMAQRRAGNILVQFVE